ncbi:MAG: glycoside hydrolase family 15 protein [Chloroflexota bacterium]|nr:glycoside hydrolase family 15 protein [Chloroflexota bacterium]
MLHSARPRELQPPIGDYGFLSDCHSAALVDREGSIDWWCVPRFDSPSVLGRLLDPEAGHWALQPVEDFASDRQYIGDTLALRTVFQSASGKVAVTDALALEPGARGHDIGLRSPHVLLRRVEGLAGVVKMSSELAPRVEYGRTEPYLSTVAGGVEARGGPVRLTCTSSINLSCECGVIRAVFSVAAGETVDIKLSYATSFPAAAAPPEVGEPSIEDTLAAWASWSAQHTSYDGAFPEQVRRSSLVLQGLTYQPSGAVLAAATTSLPETLGGELNFDYRYAWLRDLSLTIRSLWLAACPHEPSRLFEWLTLSAGHMGDELVQIMFGVEGERDLTEHVLEHLAGYRGSSPVRVGNQAWEQQQLDVIGEVLDAAHLLQDKLGKLEPAIQEMLVALGNRAASAWGEPDAGMWEARDKQRQYVSSKVMCWVALDRAVCLAPHLGDASAVGDWRKARDEVRAVVLEQAWSAKAEAYTGAFGSDDLDASVLLLPVVGFLPASDDRMLSTIEAVERELGEGGLVRRWPSDESGFLICTYWLVECLALAGENERARHWFHRATDHANDLGLLSEEADLKTGELLGNYPQAFSHVGLINAAWRLGQGAATAK